MIQNQSLSNPTLNHVFDDIFKEVINLKKETTKQAKALVTEVINNVLIPKMKDVDNSFRSIYQEIFYAGSFYDGLKINAPDEFDINVVLAFPVSDEDLKLYTRWTDKGKEMEVFPGHGFYCSQKDPTSLFHPNHPRYDDWRNLEKLFVQRRGGFHVSTQKVKSWFQGVVQKALKSISISDHLGVFTIKVQQETVRVTTKASGPAWTLQITTSSNKEIDIDLVPVFYSYDGKESSKVYLVPKSPEMGPLQWRISYANQERQLLRGNSCAKKVIKLLKRLRDIQGAPWKKLCSYHLKNFVLLELRTSNSWDESRLGEIFLTLLNKLNNYLQQKKMPSRFDEKHNIIFNVGSITIDNIRSKLTKIIDDINRNSPINSRKYFKENEVKVQSYQYYSDNELSPCM